MLWGGGSQREGCVGSSFPHPAPLQLLPEPHHVNPEAQGCQGGSWAQCDAAVGGGTSGTLSTPCAFPVVTVPASFPAWTLAGCCPLETWLGPHVLISPPGSGDRSWQSWMPPAWCQCAKVGEFVRGCPCICGCKSTCVHAGTCTCPCTQCPSVCMHEHLHACAHTCVAVSPSKHTPRGTTVHTPRNTSAHTGLWQGHTRSAGAHRSPSCWLAGSRDHGTLGEGWGMHHSPAFNWLSGK